MKGVNFVTLGVLLGVVWTEGAVHYNYNPVDVPQGAASLAFVFDVTGSMYDDLVQVIEGAAKILATTLARREKPLFNYVLVPFHDPEIGPVTVTTDHQKFQEELRELYVQGGGDCPEMSIGAIKMALEEGLPNSFIYVFTDARAKDYALTEQVLTLIQTKQSQVVFVMTGDCGNTSHPGYKSYEQIAATSSGQVFLLKKSQVNQILNFVRVAVQSRKVNLLSADLDSADSVWYTLAIDSRLQDFTVSLSGLRPKIILKDPKGNKVGKADGMQELLKLNKALIVAMKDPKPGLWKLRIVSEGPHTVRVTGLSSLDFVYGFSRNPTLDLSQTERRPIRGIPTYLLLNATDLRYPGRMTNVELMSLRGSKLTDIPLVYDQNHPALYNVSGFVPPNEFFYIKINGIDHKGYEFQRTTPTAISPINPNLPLVKIPKVTHGYFDTATIFTCDVESMVPFKVQWYHGTEPLGNILFFTESSNVTLRLPSVSSFAEGHYSCNASNVAGWTEGRTYLDVKDPPPSIEKPHNISVLPGNSGMLTCMAYSTVEFNLTWFRGPDHRPLRQQNRITVFTNGSVKISDVKKSDEGEYVCRAENEGGYTEEKLHLLVQKVPIVVLDPSVRPFQHGETLNVTCTSIAYPTPAYLWKRNGILVALTDRISYDEEGHLSIRNMQRADEGDYVCEAKNIAGKGHGTVTLQYIEAPRITVPNQRILVNNGDTATLTCKADGIPPPKITWKKGDLAYQDLSFIQITDEGELIILGTQDMDAGEYTCIATNYAGQSTANVRLEVGSAPVITKAPSSVGVNILKNITLPCAARGIPQPDIIWQRNDNDVVHIGQRFTLLGSGSLHIREVHKQDEGMYTCSVQNQFGVTEVSAFLTVTGIVRPLIAYTNPKLDTIVGRDVRLTCIVLLGNPAPRISWLKMGEVINPKDYTLEDAGGTLIIKDVQVSDEGEYTCVASNVGGNATYVTVLDVQVPPGIDTEGDNDFKVIQDQSIRLPCKVSGDPRPQITWTKNGVRISEQNPHYFINEDGSLEIFSADPQDTATYSCTAINVAGVSEKRITLFVQLPPLIAKDQHDYTVIVNNPVQIPCEVQGNPTPEITWHKDGELLSPKDAAENLMFLSNGALRISSAAVEDAGMYECKAVSVAGNATKVITLYVQVPPRITSESDLDLTVLAGKSITLDCETEGDPPPVIRWRKDLQEINFFDTSHKYMLKDTGSLIVPNTHIDDTARYLCIAENPAGIVTREISLVVYDPPKVRVNLPSNVTVIENNRVTLACPATGTPQPLITWYKEGAPLTGNEIGVRILLDGSLQLETPGAEDTGQYKCLAENVAGNYTHIVDLHVYLPPRIIDEDGDHSGDDRNGDPERTEAVLNETVILTCPVLAIPPPQITWYKNGEELTAGEVGEGRVLITKDGRELTLHNVVVDDTARYTCVAKNLAGQTEKNTDLSVYVPPTIDEDNVSKDNLSVIVEQNIAIDCPVHGVPPPAISWFKDGFEVVPEFERNIRIKSEGRRLEITEAEVSDSGRYKCVAKNPAGRVDRGFFLNVWVPAKIDGSKDVSIPEVVVNQTITLLCPASGSPNPTISWYKDDKQITINTSRIVLLDNSWKLQIRHSQTSDTSRYKCHAKNIAGEAEKYFDLQVLVPPRIQEGNLDQEPRVILNRTISLNCPAVGIPSPEIIWHRNDEEIKPDLYPSIQLVARGRQLRIEKAQIPDTAKYRCIATNKAGRDFIDFNLEVQIPVTIERTDLIFDPTVIANRSETLDCPADGTPKPFIRWFKDGELVTVDDQPHLRIKHRGKQLEIVSAQVSDSGRYECRATNEAGNDQIVYNLQVWIPPRILYKTSSPAEPQVIVNQTTIIKCFVSGTPTPNIRWLKNGRPLETKQNANPRYRIMSEGRQLEISRAEVTDTARYSCIATNEAGVADKDFDLDVLVPPHIDLTDIELKPKVTKGRPITLNCPAQGVPFPNVTWFKEREPVKEDGRIRFLASNRQLEISYTQEKDTARYTCVASNIAGQTKLDFDLHVLVPPSIDEANIVDNPRVVINRTVLLECPVAGIPPPAVKWLKNGQPLQTDRTVTLLSDGRQLEITSAQVTDTARYTCIASNEAGELQRNFDVEVLVPPTMPRALGTEDITVVENRTVYVDCPVEGVPPPSILWMKDRQPLLDFPYPNLRELSKGRQLEIRSVKVTDGGRYTCIATNVAGQLEKNFNVKVLVPPRIPRSRDITDLNVNVRQPIRIECQPTGVPEPVISWLKDGDELEPHEARHIRLLQKGRVLQIIAATTKDAGRYTCSAKNEAGQEQRRYTLQVFVPPKINNSLRVEKQSVVLGASLTLTCLVSGTPHPNIRWIRQGRALTFVSNPNLQIIDKGRQLQIVNAQLIDIGSYTCEASNVAGNASKEYSVSVLVPPTVEEGPTEVAATVNTHTLLLCETLGLPDPTITWEKDSREIPNNGLRYRMHRSGSLEFSSVKVEDSGIYKCTATNEAGTADRTITLAVQVPPELSQDGPQDVRVTEGEAITLPCKATGVPKPRISWNKGNHKLGNSVDYELFESGGLRIRRAEIADSGIYICSAENNAGNALKQVRLEVQVPPSIEEQQTEFTVVEKREVMLPCRANGIPVPKVTWEKDGQVISPSDLHYRIMRSGWLAIHVTRVEDSGSFTCIAENEAGRSSVVVDLVVQVPPMIVGRTRIMTGTQGQPTSLDCKSSGFPPPKISWIHDGRTMIHEGGQYSIDEDGMLTIEDVTADDRGSYVCTAINEAGRDSRETILRVQVPPVFTTRPQDQEVTANGRIALECAAEGIPTPSITWKVNNTAYASLPSVNGRSRITIDNAMKRDDGTYMCVAENVAGLRRAIAAVRVKVPPRVLIPPGNHAVTLQERVILSCSVGGDPAPKITWTKNGREVFLDERIQQLGNGSLVIYDSASDDAGEYKCVATNEAGSSEGTAHLIIRSPPNFKIEPRSLTVDQGHTVLMNCVAEGEPEPTIIWRKERDVLTTHDRLTVMSNQSLRIITAQLSDSGIYFCIARNYLGSVLVQAELTVQVHGLWAAWSSWSDCSSSCGQGTRFRTRACDNPEPTNGGKACVGKKKESKQCTARKCPVDGKWGKWSLWEPCSKSCSQGERSRQRECNAPSPQYGGRSCEGPPTEKVICNVKACPIDGQWGDWGPWQRCSETCGEGTKERYRRCDQPRAQYGGRECVGSETQRTSCKNRDCAVHGAWGAWTEWSACTLSCGGGSRQRVRRCESPSPTNGGRYCAGADKQIDYCNKESCAIHGNWAEWSPWGDCTMTCGGGQRRRFRTCTNPEPRHNGRPCIGLSQDTEHCNEQKCAVDGDWGPWGSWSDCTRSCGSGNQKRYRVCHEPLFGGKSCLGDESQVRKCNVKPCTAGLPQQAVANVIGNINDKEFGIAKLYANITRSGKASMVKAELHEIPPSIESPYLQHLISILAPVYWTTATEVGKAVNGFSLTEGKFRREVQVEFTTGETLRMTHNSRGIDENGVLQVDIVLNGNVPILPPMAEIHVLPYTENYIQTGPGAIYAQSSRMFNVNGISLPYAWNHTISYDPLYGRMPYLVQRLTADDLYVEFDISKDVLQYQVSASIAKGHPSNRCPKGFFLDSTGPYCKDDDECQRVNPCSHQCHNTPGSYACSCPHGLSLYSDGKTCKDVDECDLRIARCYRNQECLNVVGSYRCLVKCRHGFRRLAGGRSCQDINECRERGHGCDHKCLNTIGSYRCSCNHGYRLYTGKTCQDIDECADRNPCGHNCENTPGSFRCTCPAGFQLLNNGACRDVDECLQGLHNCKSEQECENTPGGYKCINTCPTGLERAGNGTCIDVNECLRGLSSCHYNQVCKNTFGGYVCACPHGYRSDGPGRPCVDIDECKQKGRCQHSCQNTPGSFRCICPTGYRLGPNHRSCKDINECRELQIDCGRNKLCFNTRGDYECLDTPCPLNYNRDQTTGSCVLECTKSGVPCPPGSRYTDILEFRTVALPNGIPAFQDLIRLIAYDQFGTHLPKTSFTIIDNDDKVPFSIRIEHGKGIVYTLKPLEEKTSYRIKVRSKSYDHRRRGVQYQTTFIIFISVSAYPY